MQEQQQKLCNTKKRERHTLRRPTPDPTLPLERRALAGRMWPPGARGEASERLNQALGRRCCCGAACYGLRTQEQETKHDSHAHNRTPAGPVVQVAGRHTHHIHLPAVRKASSCSHTNAYTHASTVPRTYTQAPTQRSGHRRRQKGRLGFSSGGPQENKEMRMTSLGTVQESKRRAFPVLRGCPLVKLPLPQAIRRRERNHSRQHAIPEHL